MRKKLFLLCLPAFMLWVSCSKSLPDYGTTPTVNMSNGWWVTLNLGNVAYTPPVFLSTYNTSENPDSMWVDDLKNGYGFKCKAKVDYSHLTFSATNVGNSYFVNTTAFPASVTLLNGKILRKAGHSKAGNMTDSIYMQAVFSDDPGDTWTIAGTARTGFIEDDY